MAPLALWASLWAHPRTPAHALSFAPTVLLYRRADAVVTYGRHVTSHVERYRGGRGNVFEAPQSAPLGEVLERPAHDGFRLLLAEGPDRAREVAQVGEA